MASRVSVGLSISGADKLVKQLEALEIAIRERIGKDALNAAMAPIEATVRSNTPESSASDSRRKQSAKTRQRWSGSKKLKDTIRSVVRTRKRAGITAGLIGFVGPSYSDGGGHGNLFSRDHKRRVLWGRDTGTTRVVNQFVKKSADESRGIAESALIASLRSSIAQQSVRSTHG